MFLTEADQTDDLSRPILQTFGFVTHTHTTVIKSIAHSAVTPVSSTPAHWNTDIINVIPSCYDKL